jgi:hypothetical protein
MVFPVHRGPQQRTQGVAGARRFMHFDEDGGITRAVAVKAILTPPCLFYIDTHEWNTQGVCASVRMTC